MHVYHNILNRNVGKWWCIQMPISALLPQLVIDGTAGGEGEGGT